MLQELEERRLGNQRALDLLLKIKSRPYTVDEHRTALLSIDPNRLNWKLVYNKIPSLFPRALERLKTLLDDVSNEKHPFRLGYHFWMGQDKIIHCRVTVDFPAYSLLFHAAAIPANEFKPKRLYDNIHQIVQEFGIQSGINDLVMSHTKDLRATVIYDAALLLVNLRSDYENVAGNAEYGLSEAWKDHEDGRKQNKITVTVLHAEPSPSMNYERRYETVLDIVRAGERLPGRV